jgi:hypothetical protein
MFGFGAGRARIIPFGGTPYELGVVQSASAEFKVDLKELRSTYRYPVAVADGKGTASGKVSFANLWPPTLAEILSSTAPTQTGQQAAINEAQTIPSYPGPYTVTLTNAATMVAGSEIVVVTIAGVPYYYSRSVITAHASATNPLNGSYTISAGVLTFNVLDAGEAISVTYLYTPAGTANATIALSQLGMNSSPTFQLTLIGTGKNYYSNATQQFIIVFNAVLAPSLKFDFKLDDFTMLDLDYQAFIDGSGNLGSLYFVSPDA